MPAGRIRQHQGSVAGDQKAERHQKGMQQRGVIGVLEVFVVQLPVARKAMAIMAENARYAAVERGLEFREDLGTEIVRERLNFVAIRSENHAAMGGDLQPLQAMLGGLEILRHAARAINAAPKWHPRQIALQIV